MQTQREQSIRSFLKTEGISFSQGMFLGRNDITSAWHGFLPGGIQPGGGLSLASGLSPLKLSKNS